MSYLQVTKTFVNVKYLSYFAFVSCQKNVNKKF